MSLTLKILGIGASVATGTTVALTQTAQDTTKTLLVKNVVIASVVGSGAPTVDIFIRQGTGGASYYFYKGVAIPAGTGLPYVCPIEFTLNLTSASPDILYMTVGGGGSSTVDFLVNGFERTV